DPKIAERSRRAGKMAREGAPESKTRGNGRKLTRERGRLRDSLGAWNMSDEEEERIVSSLKKNWKRTTLAIRTAEEKPPEDDQDVDKLVKSLLKLKKTGKEPLILHRHKPATVDVRRGRSGPP